jgi:hypothetical protein
MWQVSTRVIVLCCLLGFTGRVVGRGAIDHTVPLLLALSGAWARYRGPASARRDPLARIAAQLQPVLQIIALIAVGEPLAVDLLDTLAGPQAAVQAEDEGW